jgi:hypothetical protein
MYLPDLSNRTLTMGRMWPKILFWAKIDLRKFEGTRLFILEPSSSLAPFVSIFIKFINKFEESLFIFFLFSFFLEIKSYFFKNVF